jgi:hypothetical protein
MTSPMRTLMRKNQRYAGSAISRIATTPAATSSPADPLKLNRVSLNPEPLPDSGSTIPFYRAPRLTGCTPFRSGYERTLALGFSL